MSILRLRFDGSGTAVESWAKPRVELIEYPGGSEKYSCAVVIKSRWVPFAPCRTSPYRIGCAAPTIALNVSAADKSYFESATGVFAIIGSLATFTRQQQLWTAMSQQPHNRAHFGFELRPFSRLRVIDSVYTDRLHTDSAGQGSATGLTTTSIAASDRLVANYNQQLIEALVDVTNKITFRGGHRYTWGDSSFRAPSLAAFSGLENGELSRQTVLGGLSYRAMQSIWASADVEIARSDKVYLRTSLRDYERYRARVRWQFSPNVSVSWNFAYLGNQTPTTALCRLASEITACARSTTRCHSCGLPGAGIASA